MKITRVLLASTNDPIYYEFWNPISKIYSENFGIKPTLIWMGSKQELDELYLSDEYGEIIVQKPVPEFDIGWQSAWSIFWFMSLYPNDVFCTLGIDQVPLSKILISDIPEKHSDDTYLMLVDNGYHPHHWSNKEGTSPTSFHILKGSIACKVYGFEESFEDEIVKIATSGIKPFYQEKNWGLDESYSSHKLRQYRDSGGKIASEGMFEPIKDMRIECCRTNEPQYSREILKSGLYGDAHFCRPYSQHKSYIDEILNDIPKYG